MSDQINTQAVEPTTEQANAPAPLTEDRINEIVNSRINNFVHSQKTDIAKMRNEFAEIKGNTAAHQATSQTSAQANAQTGAQSQSTDTDQRYTVLERQIRELQAENETAKKRVAQANRETALNNTLNSYQFANEASREMAFKVFAGEMQEIGEGQYAIGDQTLSDAIKTRMENLSGLLAPKNVNGSGATKGSAPNQKLEYRKGMTKDEQQALVLHLSKQI